MSADSFKVRPLTSSNYFSWRREMEAYLITKDLWDAIEENAAHLADEHGETKSRKARAHVLMCTSEKLRGLIPSSTGATGKQAWKALENFCMRRAAERKTELHQQLAQVSQQSGERVSEFLLRAEDLRTELTQGCGESVSDGMMMGLLLNGVSRGFSSTIEALRCQSDLTLEVLKEKLMAAESRKLIDGPPGRALDVRGSTKKLAKSRKPDQRHCFHCGQVGHLKHQCPRLASKGQTRGPQDTGRCLAMANEQIWGNPRAIRFDTCATYHMCNNLAFMSEVTDDVPVTHVEAGGGEPHLVCGQGPVTVSTEHGPIRLTALYVPTLKTNLLSWRMASSRPGVEISSNAGPNMRVMRHNQVLFDTEWADGLLTVKGELKVEQAPVPGVACAVTASTWHKRFGHVAEGTLARMVKGDTVSGLKVSGSLSGLQKCSTCFAGKQTRLPFEESTSRAKEPLGLVHADVIGKVADRSLGGAHYALTVMDDCTRYSAVVPLSSKATAAQALIDVLQQWQRQTEKKVKVVRTDGGTEFKGAFESYCKDEGIIHQTSVRYTPQHNARVERNQRTALDMARCMMQEAKMPVAMWAEALTTAHYLRNVTVNKVVMATPYELFHSKKPDVSLLKVFGSLAHVHVPKEQRSKFDARSVHGVFVGYGQNTKGWRVLTRQGGVWHAVTSRDVVFDENSLGMHVMHGAPVATEASEYITLSFNDSAADRTLEAPEEVAQEVNPAPAIEPDGNDAESGGGGEPSGDGDGGGVDSATTDEGWETDSQGGSDYADAAEHMAAEPALPADLPGLVDMSLPEPTALPETAEPRRSSRVTAKPSRYHEEYHGRVAVVGFRDLTDEPQSLKEVRNRPDAALWDESMCEEMCSLQQKLVYKLTELPSGKKALPSRWVYKIKRDEMGRVVSYKSRVVAKGYLQRTGMSGGLSSEETFAPASNMSTLRVLLSLVAQRDYDAHHLDVKTAFLNGELETEVYIKCPPGFEVPGKVWKLEKALYGLRQAAQAWHKKLKASLLGAGFSVSLADPCLYMMKVHGECVYMLVHVDDCLVAGSTTGVQTVKTAIKALFDVKDTGPVSFFLGLQVVRDRTARKLWLGQPRYVETVLEQLCMADCKPRVTPLDCGTQLNKVGEHLKPDVPFSALVGSLLYLSTSTRPDIAHAVGMLSRFVSNPCVKHWKAAKSVLRYLSGTRNLGLCYGDCTQTFVGYTDSDFAGDVNQRKSTGGFVFMYGGSAVAWSSKLQTIVATSTCEAELVAAARGVKEALYFGKLLTDLHGVFRAVTICVDNQAAIVLLRNPAAGAHTRAKHVDVCYYFARHRVAIGDVKVEYIATTHMVADVMTKQLPGPAFRTHRTNMGVVPQISIE